MPRRAVVAASTAAVLVVVAVAGTVLIGSGDDEPAGPVPTPVASPGGSPSPTASASATPTVTHAAAAPSLEERSIVDERPPAGSDPGYAIDVSYPALTGMEDQQVQASVNADLESQAEARVTAFRELIDQVGTTDDLAPPNELIVRYEVGLVTVEILSVRFEVTEYTGGAHPLSVLDSVTYDLRAGTEVGYEALFGDGVLEVVSQEAIAQLSDDFGTGEWASEGAAPDPTLLRTFLVTPDGLEVGFDNYQVGPYAIGTPIVSIPWTVLDDHIPERSLLAAVNAAG